MGKVEGVGYFFDCYGDAVALLAADALRVLKGRHLAVEHNLSLTLDKYSYVNGAYLKEGLRKRAAL